ncbi:MAG: aminotransferase class III-fold pyridoxal phosphate-dependent enzyme [Planctomycetota bacterium]
MDRKSFPAPSTQRPDIPTEFVPPTTGLESQIAEIWSDILLIDGLGIHDNFFELGGNSIRAAQVIARVNRETDIQINTAQFFDNPTIASFAKIAPSGAQKSTWFARFQANKKSHHPPFDGPNSKDSCDGGYAIVGMSARMPGADDLDQFWDNLIEQRETISFFTPEELDPSLNVQETRAENYVAARGVIDRAEYFDARFFRTPPRNAELTDPQQRILLELAWAALEDAGINPFDCRDSVGVWAGAYSTSYYIKNVLTNPDLVRQTGEFNVGVLNEKDYIATRIAHALDLKGPAINVNTACSTSLVALIEACKSLAARHCDAALAGGVSIYFPQKSGHLHQTGSIFSPDGHCRPFDADSAGTLFSDGAGLVVVKRLADAIANRDRIYAVVKGFGLNNDGGQKASFSAPSIQGQANAIAMAHAMANIPVETIGYIEAHGTATPIGDPIEVSALQSVFESQTNQKKFCGIGSVKSNIGHTVAAAGVAGLIKAAKSLFHETVPATLHFEKPNPEIDFESSPFFVCDQNMPWERCDTPRRAGISSFGVGGTNAHIILEEAPSLDDETLDDNSRLPFAVIPISAKSEKSLQQNVERLTHHLSHRNADDWDRIVDSLQTRRSVFSYRAAVVASDSKSAADSLGNRCVQSFFERKSTAGRPLIFMFPGQGSQYVNMGQNLYEQSSVFKANLDQCSEILTPLLGQDLRTILYPEPGHEESAQQILKNTRFTQPALFALGYSLGQVWLKWGIEPAGLMGHSIGEFAAACTAGVFELEDGLKMIAERGRLMQELPGGSMLSVRLPGDEVEPMLFGQMAIGSFNGPQLCVVAGPTDQVKQLQNELESQDVVCRYLHTSHAFHSPMMNSIVDPFEEFVGQFPLQAPKIPILSTVTGDWMKEADARNPKYWANHLRAPVRFSDAVLKMWDPKEGDANRVLIEIGPRKTLATLAKQHATDRKNQIAIPTLSDTAQDQKEWKTMFAALAQLWVAGVTIDWSKIAGRSKGQPRPIHISLPTYAFDRKKYFIEPGQVAHSDSVQATPLTNKIEADKTAGCHHERLSKQPVKLNSVETHTMNRVPEIVKAIQTIFEETSGFDLTEFEGNTTFFEMGLDSLVLTQTATALKKEMAIDVTFRQLLEDTSTVDLLAQWLDERLPSEMYAVTSTPTPAPVNQDAAVPNVEQPRQPAESISPGVESQQRLETLGEVQPLEPPTPVAPVSQSSSVVAPPTLVKQPPMPTAAMSGQNDVANIIQSQLQLMQMQMQLLSNAPGSTMASQPIMDAPGSTLASQPIMDAPGSVAADPNGTGQQFADTAVSNSQAVDATGTANNRDDAPEKELAGNRANPDSTDQLSQPAATSNSTDDVQPKKAKRFDTVKRNDDKLDAHQQQALDEIVRLNNIMMPGSKAYAQKHRKYMADPRTVSGFRPNMKEMTHPIVIERSRGVHLWDIDGNEYIDFTCGFGSNLLGHTHDVTVQAITEQVQKDYAIGPQSPLAGEVASLFCELTGHQRMAFSNTGSEAVLGCTRLARNATGKDLIVMFNGDYHGILDEVIARGSKRMKSFPAATGIPKDHVGNTLILEYGSNESLKIINQRMDEIAGILVEPVQSRKPELQPREFLHELRAMTKDQPAALIFDEVISGLRIGLGGAQQHFDVKADLASYGKIFGGGMPIGLIGGKSEYMDGLDGGYWQYGDDSRPEAGMTYFAGTFVRHPLTLAASKAIMDYLKAGGQPMYDRLNALADYLADELNQVFTQLDAPLFLANFGSLFKIQFHQEVVYSEVFFAGLRRRGMHIWDHRPCLLTLAHQKDHIDKMVEATRATIIECQRFGFMPGQGFTKFSTEMSEQPPVPGAEIGKDESGNMGWFLADTLNPGQFIQVGQFSN